MSTFAYHFHAKVADDRAGPGEESHGIVTTTERIDHQDKYGSLCKDIAQFMGLPDTNGMVLTSLTFLHEVP